MKEKTFAISTLGCKVNQEEAAALEAAFFEAGYQEVEFSEPADIYIINTCTVTGLADKKSRALIRRANKTNPEALVVVTGCYAQVSPQDIASLEGVDLILGVDERAELLSIVQRNLESEKTAPQVKISDVSKTHDFIPLPIMKEKLKRARAFLKIQDGCNQFCHYCIIPYARGASRSLPLDQVLERAKRLIELGHLEIVLSGIHIGVYGKDLKSGENLYSLVKEILKLPGLGRLHLGSLEIQHIDERLINIFLNNSLLCPHLHIPLQSGSDKILNAMGRKYTTNEYETTIQKIRQKLPEISITTDVITGFPGEGEEEFWETINFCQKIAFSKMHIFPYSPRKGTKAFELKGQVDPKEKRNRVKILATIDEDMQAIYANKFIDRELVMLTEQKTEIDGKYFWSGHSENYLPLILPLEHGEKGRLLTVYGDKWRKNCLLVKKEKQN